MRENLRYLMAYLMWAAVMASGLWLGLVGRTILRGLLASYAAESTRNVYQAGFFDKAYVVLAGLLWVIVMVAVEHYFRQGVPRRQLASRFARVAGLALLLVLVADLGLLALQGGSGSGLRWLMVAGELVIGASLLAYGLFSRPARPQSRGMGQFEEQP